MSANLRPTAPAPTDARPYLPEADVARAITCGGAFALGLYGAIVALRAAGEPCTIPLLAEALDADVVAVARAVDALLDAGLIARVEEPEEGGA